MNLENQKEVISQKAKEIIDASQNKTDGIVEAIEYVQTETHKELIEKLQNESEEAKSNKQFQEKMGLRILNKEEKKYGKE